MFLTIVLLYILASFPAFGRDYTQTVVQKFSSYKSLQSQIISLVSKSKKSVRIGSFNFQDGDVASAAILAFYRNVEVMVFVEKEGSKDYLSQVQRLRQNHVPVFLMPEDFFHQMETSSFFQVDDEEAFTVPCELISRLRCKNPSFLSMNHNQEYTLKEKIASFSIKNMLSLAQEKILKEETLEKKENQKTISTSLPKVYRVGYDGGGKARGSLQKSLPKITIFRKKKSLYKESNKK